MIEKQELETNSKARPRPSFLNYLLCFHVFIAIMIVATVVWSYVFGFRTPGLEHYGNWRIGLYGLAWDDIHERDFDLYYEIFSECSFLSLLKVEALFYFLPFLLASVALCFIKRKKWKVFMGILFGWVVLCLQMQFGYLHYDAFYTRYMNDNVGKISQHILLFGGEGLLLAITYGLVLHFTYKTLLKGQQAKDKLKAVLLSHPMAILASMIVLATVWASLLGILIMGSYLLIVITVILIICYFIRRKRTI